MARMAVPRTDPEAQVAEQRRRLLAGGDAVRAEGTGAVRGFDSSKYLGADALKSIFEEATTTSFMPQLRQLQARNARTNVRGPLKGAVEGDLASAFRRQLLAKVAEAGATRAGLDLDRAKSLAEIGGTDRAQGISLLGTELEVRLAREQAKREEKAGKRRFFGSLIGGVGGFLAGGPAGAAAGARIGGSL